MREGMTVTVDKDTLTADDEKRIRQLLGPAQKGDKKALAELRPVLEKVGLWKYIGDLTRRIEESWLDAMTGQNKLIREAYEKELGRLRKELLESGDSPLERLLVDRVVACWLQVAHADMGHASLMQQDGYSFREGAYQQERQDRAHARFLKAVKTLATVRRLLVPAVQVNIARNQIVSQGAMPDPSREALP